MREWVLPTIKFLEEELKTSGGIESNAISFAKIFPQFGLEYYSWLARSEACLYPNFGNINIKLLGPLETISRLYPAYLGPGFIVRSLRERSISDLRKRLLQDSNRDKKRFSDLSEFLDRAAATKNGSTVLLRIDIEPEDAWWLEELGVRKMLAHVEKSLHSIRKDIEGRAHRRHSILEEFL